MSTVALSSLNRAALAAKEGYLWINGIALALSAVIARMSWSAYALIDQHDRALVCITAQALAIALAILARRALTGQMPLAGMGGMLLAAGCAWWASHGLALAWYGDQERNSEPMVIFMAALEPCLFLLAEHVREGREALRAAHEKDEAETAAELARIRARDSAQWGPRLVASGGAALGTLPAAANASELAPVCAQSPEPFAIVSTNTGYASAREHAIALKRNNPALTQEQIGAHVGAPRSTVGKWLRTAQAA
jgi:hypothetical protein